MFVWFFFFVLLVMILFDFFFQCFFPFLSSEHRLVKQSVNVLLMGLQ